MKKVMLLILMCFLALSPIATASDIWEMADSNEYGKKTWGMLGRGLVNAASCFVDLAVQTVEKTQEGPPLVGTLTGIGSGAGCTILRAGSGILDVASFWVPDFNGLPVARSYSNCLLEDTSRYPAAGEGDYGYDESWRAPVAQTAQTRVSSSQSSSGVRSWEAPSSQAKRPSSGSESGHDAMDYVKK